MATFTYNGHSYLLSKTGTWQDAQAEALSLGGNLVTINDQAEQDWLASTFGTTSNWIGYTDQETEGVWKWVSGENSTYTSWANGEPNDANGEDYGHMWALAYGELAYGNWNDNLNNAFGNIPGIIEISNSANVSVVFSDNFDTDNLATNQTIFAGGWTVFNGSVDLVGSHNYVDYLHVNGRYVDLDGSTLQAGYFAKSMSLIAGLTYTANFQLAGNHYWDYTDTVDVNFGSTSMTYSLSKYDQLSSHSLTFSPASSGNYSLSFHNQGGDNVGALLDNVLVTIPSNPKLTLSAGANPVEGGKNGIFTITLDSPAPADGLTVKFNTTGSTATFGTDYNLLAGTNVSNVTTNSFKIAAGATTATLKLAALADTVTDPNEAVSVNLIPGTGYSLENDTTTFADKVDYSLGVGTNSVNVGDFNSDGKSDLVVVNKISDSNNTVSVLLRNADNTGFDSKIEIATGSNPEYVNVGDFNNDGKTDIAIANAGGNTFSILLRNVNNTGFESKVDYLTNWNPNAISSGDFNNDGKTDLVVANSTYSSVSVFFRNATNTDFDAKVNYLTGWAPNAVSSGDFNNDGKTDLVAANLGDGTVSVLLRNSTNTGFDAKLDYITGPKGSQPISVDVGDFNNDGRTDIVVTNWAGSVSVLLRNSNNTGFDDAVSYPITAYGGKVSVGDFNNDGKDDLAVSNSYSNAVSVFTRNAANTDFDKKVDYYATDSNSGSASVSVGDFNNDGKTDLVASNSSGTISVLLNTSATNAALTIINVAPVLNHAPDGSVRINDTTPQQNQTLTLSNSLADIDGLGAISYQWQANNTNIGTGESYTLTSKDLGKTIHVIASYTDDLGNAESVSSANTSPVTAAPLNAGFNINPVSLQTTGEDGTVANYNISLNTPPLANQNVIITFASSDTSEGIVDNPTLTFTSSNYATPQTLTVRGADDYLDDGNIPYLVTAKVSTIDVFYKSLTISPFNLTNVDDGLDTPLDLYGDQGGSKIDVLSGGNGADTLHGKDMADNLSGGLGNDTLYGGYGADNLFGEDGNDKLSGEQENDYLDGGTGNDVLDGGDGADTMIGGAGNDTYYLGYDAVDVIDDQGLITDVDTVIMPYQLSKYTLPTGIEQGSIAPGTQASSLTGNTGNNTLTGNDGKNTLNGAVGRDSLFGGAGDDVLVGGTGNDTLTGGSGKDSFLFDTSLFANVDKITDFKPVDDTIKLENKIFTKLMATGTLDSTNFFMGTTAHDKNDYVIYNPTTGAVTYDLDAAGAGGSIQIAMIGSNLVLTSADFVII